MIRRFDHLTIVVDDLADAKRFFGIAIVDARANGTAAAAG